MSNLKVKSGKSELTLHKSQRMVGLKTVQTRGLEKPDFVEAEILQNLGGFNIVTLKDSENIDTKLDEVREREEVEVGTHVYFAEGSERPVVPTGIIYISFHAGVSEAEQKIVLDEYSLELVERRNPEEVVVRVTPNSPNPLKVATVLQQISLVRLAEPDIDTVLDEYAFAVPADDLLAHEWHLQNVGILPDINYPLKKGADAKVIDAWKRLGNTGSSNITIALIDNGFDIAHPDLRDKVVKPFDVLTGSNNVPQGDPNFTHGTPCASVALASSNGQGMVGAAPNARFMPIHGTTFSDFKTEAMFKHCIKNGADIISCSWGTTEVNFTLGRIKEEAIARAAREGRNGKGCIILFAVGNDEKNFVNFYAAHPDVIAVGACTSKDDHAFYSNQGREVTVCAPSNGDWPIIAARAWWDQGRTHFNDDRRYWDDGRPRGSKYKHFGGTSSATPLVAGICALMLSANPDLTAREVKEILQQTADKIGQPWEYDSAGHSPKYGYGKVNADKAVAEALRRRDATSAPVMAEVQPSISGGKGLFRFDVKKQNPEGWGVQVGAFFDYGNVLIQTEKLQSQFAQPIVVNINELEGKTVYKLVVGVFTDVDDAKKLNQKMQTAGVKGFVRNLKDLQ